MNIISVHARWVDDRRPSPGVVRPRSLCGWVLVGRTNLELPRRRSVCLLVSVEATMASLTDASTGSVGAGSRGRGQGSVEKEDIEGLLRRLSESVRDTRWTTVCASIQSNWSTGLASKSASKSSEWVPRGKITDVAFVPKNDPAPPGYEKIISSVGNRSAELGKVSRDGHNFHLCIEREGSKPPLTGIVIVLDKDDDTVPCGFKKIVFHSSSSSPTSAVLVGKSQQQQQRAHIYCKRGFDSPPIVSIDLVQLSKGETPPANSIQLATSPSGYDLDLVGGSKGMTMQLCYLPDTEHISRACSSRAGGTSSAGSPRSNRAMSGVPNASGNPRVGSGSGDQLATSMPRAPASATRGVSHSVDVLGPMDTLRITSLRSLIHATRLLQTPKLIFDKLRPFLLGCYTDSFELIVISLHGIQACISAMSTIFVPPTSFPGDRSLLEVVLVAVCDLVDRDHRFGGQCLSIFEEIITTINGVWNFVSSSNRITCSLLNLMTQAGDASISTQARGVFSLTLKRLTKGLSKRHVGENLSKYHEQSAPVEAMVELLIEKTYRLRESMSQTNYAVVLDGKLNSVLGEWAGQMWDVAANMFEGGQSQGESKSIFVVLSLLCKQASRLGTDALEQGGGFVDIDAVSNKGEKLTSMEGIVKLLNSSNAAFVDSATFGYAVRRFVVPAVLKNAQTHDMDVFRCNLNIVSTLWKKWRAHLKIEFAIIIENLMLLTLRSVFSSPEQKIMIIREFESWFDMQPQVLVEIFLNFDNDQTVHITGALFNDFCSLLCNISEDGHSPGLDSDDQESLAIVNKTTEVLIKNNREYAASIRKLRLVALGALSHIQRGLMDASATVHLITKESDPELRVNASTAGWDAYEDEEQIGNSLNSLSPESSAHSGTNFAEGERGTDSYSSQDGGDNGEHLSHLNRRSRRASVRVRFEINKEKEKHLQAALNMAKVKSVKKAINYLLETKYIGASPRAVVNWIRLNLEHLDEVSVGDYLGEEGRSESDILFMKKLRDMYMRTMNFTAMNFVDALRTMLTRGGFRLPGEAQKIDRFIETFSRVYYDANQHLFKNADVPYVLAFSCVMLNTDAHNPGVKKRNKMSLKQYTSQLRGQGLSDEFIREVYEEIVNNEIEMPKAIDTRAATEKKRIAGDDDARGLKILQDSSKWSAVHFASLSRSIPRGLSLMKGHASKCILYYSKMDTEVVSLLLEVGWVHFYGCVTTILETTEDLEMIMLLLSHVRYTLSACLLLGMETERRAFAALLAKFSFLYSNHDWDSVGDAILFGLSSKIKESSSEFLGSRKKENLSPKEEKRRSEKEWFQHVMQASSHDKNVLDIIKEVHQLTTSIRDSIRARQQYEEVVAISRRFVGDTSRLLDHRGRRFLREGQLIKKSRRGDLPYTFFLFSDILVYAGANLRGKLKIHQVIPLDSLTLIEPGSNTLSFDVESPVKNFTIVADTLDVKHDWVEEIEQAKDEFLVRRKRGSWVEEQSISQPVHTPNQNKIPTIDLVDAIEGHDEALAYISDGENELSDKPSPVTSTPSSSRVSMSPSTPRMYTSTALNASLNTSDLRPGHMETVTAAAAVAAGSSFLQRPIPTSVAALDSKSLDAVFKTSLKLSRKVLEDQHEHTATDSQKLLFYGLFKQATSGDCNVAPPSAVDWVGSAKYDAWRSQKGSSSKLAKQQYISLLGSIAPDLLGPVSAGGSK